MATESDGFELKMIERETDANPKSESEGLKLEKAQIEPLNNPDYSVGAGTEYSIEVGIGPELEPKSKPELSLARAPAELAELADLAELAELAQLNSASAPKSKPEAEHEREPEPEHEPQAAQLELDAAVAAAVEKVLIGVTTELSKQMADDKNALASELSETRELVLALKEAVSASFLTTSLSKAEGSGGGSVASSADGSDGVLATAHRRSAEWSAVQTTDRAVVSRTGSESLSSVRPTQPQIPTLLTFERNSFCIWCVQGRYSRACSNCHGVRQSVSSMVIDRTSKWASELDSGNDENTTAGKSSTTQISDSYPSQSTLPSQFFEQPTAVYMYA
jgi:hypothetical protein